MSLFDDAVQACGVQRLLAPFVMTRLLVKANVAPARVTTEQLRTALPVIREGLAVYLAPEELERALERLERIASPTPPLEQAS